jgi:hypothetical protein
MSHSSLYRLTFAAAELSGVLFLSKLESTRILVLNCQHSGTTTTENGEVWQWLYLATRNVIWGISGGPNPVAGSLMVGYYVVSEPCRVSWSRLPQPYWMSWDDRPLVWITPRAVGLQVGRSCQCQWSRTALPRCHWKEFFSSPFFSSPFCSHIRGLNC